LLRNWCQENHHRGQTHQALINSSHRCYSLIARSSCRQEKKKKEKERSLIICGVPVESATLAEWQHDFNLPAIFWMHWPLPNSLTISQLQRTVCMLFGDTNNCPATKEKWIKRTSAVSQWTVRYYRLFL
jgi:hypothetical protein